MALSSILFTACPNGGRGMFGTSAYMRTGIITGECYDSLEFNQKNETTVPREALHIFDADCKPIKGISYTEGKRLLKITLGFKSPHYDFEKVGLQSRLVPLPEVFNQFGQNAGKVKKYYGDLYEQVDFLSGIVYGLLFYAGGLKLTADKYFVGHEPGEDLSDIVYIYSGAKANIPGAQTPDHFRPIGPFESVTIYFPVEGFELVDEAVTFNITLPLKLGMCLNWINDLLTDPDAEYKYKDVVLKQTFTINRGLH